MFTRLHLHDPVSKLPRLMYGEKDGSVVAGQFSERFHEVMRRERVQTGSRLVQEEDAGVEKQLHTDADAAALATGNAPVLCAAHLAVRHVRQTQLHDDAVHLCRRDRK